MDSPIPRLEDVEYRATHFARNDFWAWVHGATFSLGPYTGLGEGVRVVLEETEGWEGVEDLCMHCAEKWHKSEIQSSFEGVVWNTSKKTAIPAKARATDRVKRTQYEEAFIEAFYTAANYGFMDGIMRLLAVRLLDVVIYGGLCDVHRKLMVSCPSSMTELGALAVQVVKGSTLVTLKGMPDLCIHYNCFEGAPGMILIMENKTTTGELNLYPRIGQALCYLLMMRFKNMAAEKKHLPSTALFVAPDLLCQVVARHEGNEIVYSLRQLKGVKEGGLVDAMETVWKTLASLSVKAMAQASPLPTGPTPPPLDKPHHPDKPRHPDNPS